jgi:hypothetical protein
MSEERSPMSSKGEDRPEGFAAESLKNSVLQPSQSTTDHQEQGDHVQSNHSLTGRDQDGAGQVDPDRPKPEDRYKP